MVLLQLGKLKKRQSVGVADGATRRGHHESIVALLCRTILLIWVHRHSETSIDLVNLPPPYTIL